MSVADINILKKSLLTRSLAYVQEYSEKYNDPLWLGDHIANMSTSMQAEQPSNRNGICSLQYLSHLISWYMEF